MLLVPGAGAAAAARPSRRSPFAGGAVAAGSTEQVQPSRRGPAAARALVVAKASPATAGAPLRALVVGGGPAGALAALLLADRGFAVEVHERRPPPAEAGGPSDRSYNVLLVDRGLAALEAAGVRLLDDPDAAAVYGAVPISGIWNRRQGLRRSVFGRSVALDRGSLADGLLRTAGARHPGRVRITHNSFLQSVDFAEREATFETRPAGVAGPTAPLIVHTRLYDLLVGADGVGSAVRAALAQHDAGFTVQQKVDFMSYKALTLPDPGPERRTAVHVYSADGRSTLFASPRPDGAQSGALLLPASTWARLDSAEATETFLRAQFADALAAGGPTTAAVQAEVLVAQRPRPAGVTTVVSGLVGPRVALIGDAAHSCWSALGQGANSALESAAVLAAALDGAAVAPADTNAGAGAGGGGDRMQAALVAFNAARHADVLACGRLSEEGLGGSIRASTFATVARFLLVILISKVGLGRPPAAFRLNESGVSYAAIEASTAQEKALVRTVGWAALVAAAAACATLVHTPTGLALACGLGLGLVLRPARRAAGAVLLVGVAAAAAVGPAAPAGLGGALEMPMAGALLLTGAVVAITLLLRGERGPRRAAGAPSAA